AAAGAPRLPPGRGGARPAGSAPPLPGGRVPLPTAPGRGRYSGSRSYGPQSLCLRRRTTRTAPPSMLGNPLVPVKKNGRRKAVTEATPSRLGRTWGPCGVALRQGDKCGLHGGDAYELRRTGNRSASARVASSLLWHGPTPVVARGAVAALRSRGGPRRHRDSVQCVFRMASAQGDREEKR